MFVAKITPVKKIINGVMMHSQLAMSDNGIPLGLLDQKFIQRDKLRGKRVRKSTSYQKLPVNKKESQRWIDSINLSRKRDFEGTEIIHIADREGDIYELYRDCISWREKFVFRACFSRAINKSKRRSPPKEKLFPFLENQRAQGKKVLKIQTSSRGKRNRLANVSVIYKKVVIPPPANKTINKDGSKLSMLPLTAIMVVERNPPKNEKQLKWVLLTNLVIESVDDAMEKAKWYAMRWNIELFHKILKSGFSLEKSQLRDGNRLKKYITLTCILAWRIFWMTRVCEINESTDCEKVVMRSEWIILFKKFNKGKRIPSKPPPIRTVMLWIGKLGGFIGRNSDGLPGITSMWRGWMRFEDLIDDYESFCG